MCTSETAVSRSSDDAARLTNPSVYRKERSTIAAKPKKDEESFKDICDEIFFVMRPSIVILYSISYLSSMTDPSLLFVVLFVPMHSLAGMAANDYMDWENDQLDKSRKKTASRGMAKSKTRVWWYYVVSTLLIAMFAFVGVMDLGAGFMYFVMIEVLGQWLYNGLFLGIPMNRPSISKQVGFPVDILLNVIHFAFPTMVGDRSWMPRLEFFALGSLITYYAQIKDYEHEKKTNIMTTATVLGTFATKILVLLTVPILMYADMRFLPFCIYIPVKVFFPKKVEKPKLTFVAAINYVGVLVHHVFTTFIFPQETQGPRPETIADVFPSDNIFVWAGPNTETRLLKFYAVVLAVSFVIRIAAAVKNSLTTQQKVKNN